MRRNVILVNVGTPAEPSAAAVRSFLASFLSDPLVVDLPRWIWKPLLHGVVLRTRPGRVARMYGTIWTTEGSPLEAGTQRMVRALARVLGQGCDVRHAHRYGQPSLAQALQDAAVAGGVTCVPLFPQPTAATVGTITKATEAAVRAHPAGSSSPVRVAGLSANCPHYVEALAARCGPLLSEGADHMLVSFHSIPARVDRAEGEVYSRACQDTFAALVAKLGWGGERADLCYQSRFGPGRWLGPATFDRLRALPTQGRRRVVVVCPGFLTDGLETLEEIGVRGRALFLRSGGEHLGLVPAVEDHPAMIRCLASAVQRAGAPPA